MNLADPLAVQNSTVNVSSSGTSSFAARNTAPTLGGLAGAGNVVLATAVAEPVALGVGNNGQSTTFGGSLSGPGSLVKQGAGTLTLTAAQGYGGPTVISGGVLQLRPAYVIATGSIGIHFVGSAGGGSVTGSAGVVPMSNWNNLSGPSLTNQALTDYSARYDGQAHHKRRRDQHSGSSNQLLNGYIYDSDNDVLTATISGIPYAQYALYAYLVDSTAGYGEQFTVGGVSYYYSPTNTAAYTQITNSTAGTYPAGNYVLASGLTGSSQTLKVQGISSQYGSFAGFEIVHTTPFSGNVLPAATPVTISNGDDARHDERLRNNCVALLDRRAREPCARGQQAP